MKDFLPLLQKLAAGAEDVDVAPLVQRKKNAPPTPELLPSHQAIVDLHEGAMAHPAVKNGGIDWAGVIQADKQAKDYKAPPAEYYPNGVRKEAMDERTSDGRSMLDVATGITPDTPPANPEQAMKSGIRPDWAGVIGNQAPMPNGTEQTMQGDDTPITPTAGRRSLVSQPEDLQSLYGQLQQIQSEKPSKWKDAGYGALQGLLNYTNHTSKPIESYSAMRTQQKAAPILNKIGMIEHQKKFETDTAWDQARTEELRGRPAAKRAEIELRNKGVLARINANADIKAGTAKPIVNDEGYLEYQYLNTDSKGQRRPNELVTGANGQPVYISGEEGIDWKDPNTGVVSRIKAKQGVMPSATIAAGNATREQQSLKDASEGNYKAQNENVNNLIQWQNNVTNQLNTALSVDTTLQNNEVVQGLNQEVQGKQQMLQQLLAEPLDGGASDSEIKTRADRINKLSDDIFEANNKILAEVGKSEGGQAKANALRANLPARPPKVTYTPYQPVKVGGGVTGKPVPKAKDPLGIFQ